MPNHVRLDKDGIICEEYAGDQNAETVGYIVTKTEGFMAKLKAKSQPIRILVDLRNVGKEDMGARKAGWEAMKVWEYHKIAMFGANQYLRHVANLVITATGKVKSVRYFDTEKEAREWLLEP